MYQKMEDLKKDLVVKIDEGVLKFPQSQNLKNWKLLFPVEDLSTESFDFNYVSQKYKEPILTPGFVQVNDEDYGNDFLNDDENVEDYDQGKCSGGQGMEVVHMRAILVKIMLKVKVMMMNMMNKEMEVDVIKKRP